MGNSLIDGLCSLLTYFISNLHKCTNLTLSEPSHHTILHLLLNIQCTMLVLFYLLFILEYVIFPKEDIEANLTNMFTIQLFKFVMFKLF